MNDIHLLWNQHVDIISYIADRGGSKEKNAAILVVVVRGALRGETEGVFCRAGVHGSNAAAEAESEEQVTSISSGEVGYKGG